MTSKTLAGKLVAVTEAVGKIKKTGYNGHQKYEYMTEKDLVDAIKVELASRKVLVLTSVVKTEFKGDICLVETEHTFHDAESGETLTVKGSGTGYDKTDKAVFKAQTGAFKYFLMKNFLISSDDDPENDGESKKAGSHKPSPSPAKNVDSRPVSDAPGGFSMGSKPPKKEEAEVKPSFTQNKPASKPGVKGFSAPVKSATQAFANGAASNKPTVDAMGDQDF